MVVSIVTNCCPLTGDFHMADLSENRVGVINDTLVIPGVLHCHVPQLKVPLTITA